MYLSIVLYVGMPRKKRFQHRKKQEKERRKRLSTIRTVHLHPNPTSSFINTVQPVPDPTSSVINTVHPVPDPISSLNNAVRPVTEPTSSAIHTFPTDLDLTSSIINTVLPDPDPTSSAINTVHPDPDPTALSSIHSTLCLPSRFWSDHSAKGEEILFTKVSSTIQPLVVTHSLTVHLDYHGHYLSMSIRLIPMPAVPLNHMVVF